MIPLTLLTLDYAEIPSYATRLQSADPADHTIRTAPKILTPNPHNLLQRLANAILPPPPTLLSLLQG